MYGVTPPAPCGVGAGCATGPCAIGAAATGGVVVDVVKVDVGDVDVDVDVVVSTSPATPGTSV